MTDDHKYPVLEVAISAVDYETAVARILAAARDGRPHATAALAVYGLMTGVHDPVHLHRLNSLDLVVPDGQPVRWALRWLHGVRLRDRVYGPELMTRLCREAAREGLPVFLFGSTAEVLVDLCRNLADQTPGLRIAGAAESRFRTLTAAEAEELAHTVRSSGAALTFVGLGCPRQEVWAYEFAPRLSMPVVTVGAAFDFLSGHKPQAPPVLQRLGLEWLFRLCCEPRRLWRRYLLLNPEYLVRVVAQLMGIRRSTVEREPDSDILHG